MRSLLLSVGFASLASAGCAAAPIQSTGTAVGVQMNASAPAEPGDRVALRSWTEPAISDTFAIDENGRIALPTLGFMQATGMAAGRLQDSVRIAYAAVRRDPGLRVSVLRRVSVVGEVEEPGVYFADLTMGVSDAIMMAGGLTDAGDPTKIDVQRGSDLIRLSQRSHSEYALAGLRSGDEIVIQPRGFWARNPPVVLSTISTAISLLTTILIALLYSS